MTVLAIQTVVAIETLLALETIMTIVTILVIETNIHLSRIEPGIKYKKLVVGSPPGHHPH